tara:strand:- start:8883 stop:10151 length:1269 start_codon:yes stop_codon:yes gene_type:complete
MRKIKQKSNAVNVAWAVLERGVQVVLSMVLTGLIARYFGVEAFGAYQYSMAVLFVATAVTWLCPAEAFYARINKSGELAAAVISTSIMYRLIISIVVYSSILIYVLLFVEEAYKFAFVLILATSLIYSEPLGIFRFLLECQGYYHVTARLRMLGLSLKCVLLALSIWLSQSYLLVVSVLLLESMVIGVGCVILYSKVDVNYKFTVMDFDVRLAVSFFKEGAPFWVGLVAMNLFTKVDRFFMEYNLSAHDFGYYSAALSAFEQYTAIATMMIAVLGPTLIYRVGEKDLAINLLSVAGFFLTLGVIGAGGLYFASDYLIPILYGDNFSMAIPLFKYVIFFGPLVFIDVALSSLIIKNRSAYFFSLKWVVVFLVAALANYFLFETFGVRAGATAYGIGWAVALVFSLMYFGFWFNTRKIIYKVQD